MRIAFFTETFLPMTDGIVTRLLSTFDHLLELGEELMVFAPAPGKTYYKDIPVVRIPGIPLFVYPEKKITLLHPLIKQKLFQFKPELIHAVNPVNLGAFGIYYARRLDLPLVSSYHTNVPDYLDYYRLGLLKPLAWKLINWLHNKSEINLCTSKHILQQLGDHGIRNVHLWEKGLDSTKFRPGFTSPAMRKRLSDNHPQEIIFLYVGRLGFEKGLESLRPVLDKVSGMRLALVGDGPARRHLEKVFTGTNTVFTGFLYGKELAAAYASADVFVLPSTTETLGLVLMEAMASGLPVIAQAGGPASEIVTDNVSGLLFKRQEELLSTISSLASDIRLRKRLAGEARKAAVQWDWRTPTRQLRSYYNQAIESHKHNN